MEEYIIRSLKSLGEEYEKNLYVGEWNMGDRNYEVLAHEYNFQKIPCIIITSLEDLSDVDDGDYAYVKLDDRLLSDRFINETKRLIRELYNSFIREDIREAVRKAKREGFKLRLVAVAEKLSGFTQKFLRLLGDIGLTIDYARARLTLGKDSES